MIAKRIRDLVLILTISVSGLMIVAPVATVGADARTEVCKGVGIAGGGSDCADGGELQGVVAKVVNIISLVVGILAVIMVLVGGIKYITSSGDSNNVNSAKNTILYAIVGLVVAVFAQVIVRFVLARTA